MKMIYNVEDKLSFKQTLVYSLQQFLAVVCATILVPILSSGNGVNMSPAAALFGAGIATLFYVWVTKKKSPMFIGSSFGVYLCVDRCNSIRLVGNYSRRRIRRRCILHTCLYRLEERY